MEGVALKLSLSCWPESAAFSAFISARLNGLHRVVFHGSAIRYIGTVGEGLKRGTAQLHGQRLLRLFDKGLQLLFIVVHTVKENSCD